jgi:serine/threonine-protein kinase RsbW
LEGAQVIEEGARSSPSRTIAADVLSGSSDRAAGGEAARHAGGQHDRGHQAGAAHETIPADSGIRDKVGVKMPADGAYLSVLRTATAGLAARLDFTLDEIEDMRIAVDEACAMLLSQAIPGSDLLCEFVLGQDAMTVCVSVSCLAPRVPAGDTFAWTVLTALAGSVDAQVGPGDVLTIVLRKSRDSSRSV